MSSLLLRTSLATFALWTAASARATTRITHVGSGSVDDTRTGIYGLVFLPESNVTVRSVGFYDHGGDGLEASHGIGFGSGSGDDVWPFFQTRIAAGTDAPLIGGFRWINLDTPVELVAGTYYTIAGEMIANTDAMLSNNSNDYQIAPGFPGPAAREASIGMTWSNVATVDQNPRHQSSGIFIVVNFSDLELGAIPEPAGYGVIAGLAAFACVAKRRRRRTTR